MEMKAALLPGLIFSSVVFLTASAATFDVKSYGAKGDGVAKDTAAIQAAVDAAGAAGGGTVELSAGTYLSGSIWLRDNVDFYLGPGATLKGSGDIGDYCASNCCPQNSASPVNGDNTSGGHLILGVGVKNVTLRGPGRIDGNSPAFILDSEGVQYKSKRHILCRPAQMIWFVDSADIRITDLEIADSPYWSCFILNCERVFIRGCYVHTERRKYHTFNGDGIDIDRCRWVTVSDCRIDTADDCITLRASYGSRLSDPRDCSHVTVANCNLSTSCNAIRVGVGEGRISEAVFSNLTVSDSQNAFNFVASYGRRSRGTDITGIRVQNVRVDSKLFLRMHHMYSKDALFKDIVFDGISGKVEKPSCVWAKKSRPFEDIVFRNVDLSCEVSVFNADVEFDGGTVKEMQLSGYERTKIEEAIDSNGSLLY